MKAKSLNQLLYTHKKRRSEQFWWPQKMNTVWRLANELLNSFRFFFISTYFKSIIIRVIEWNVLPLRKSNANALFFKYSFTKHCFNGCAGMFTTLPELVFFLTFCRSNWILRVHCPSAERQKNYDKYNIEVIFEQ